MTGLFKFKCFFCLMESIKHTTTSSSSASSLYGNMDMVELTTPYASSNKHGISAVDEDEQWLQTSTAELEKFAATNREISRITNVNNNTSTTNRTQYNYSRLQQLLSDIETAVEIGAILFIFFATFICVEWHRQIPHIIFGVLLVVIILFIATFLFRPFRSDTVFYFWLIWVFWIMYGFGYLSTNLFLTSWFYVLLYTTFANVVYLVSVILSFDSTRAIGARLIALFIATLLIDVVPLQNNNLFIVAADYNSMPYLRIGAACLLTIVLNFQYRRQTRWGRDIALRFVLQLNYILFGYTYFVAMAFVIHIFLLLRYDQSRLASNLSLVLRPRELVAVIGHYINDSSGGSSKYTFVSLSLLYLYLYLSIY